MEPIKTFSPTASHLHNISQNKQDVFNTVSKDLQKAYASFFIRFQRLPLNHKEIVTQFIISHFHNDKDKRKLIELAQSEGNDGFLPLLTQHVSIEDCTKIVLNKENQLPYFGKTNTYSELIGMLSEQTFIEYITNNAKDLAITIDYNFFVKNNQSETKLKSDIFFKEIASTCASIISQGGSTCASMISQGGSACASMISQGEFINNFIEHAKFCVKDIFYNYINLYSQELDYSPSDLKPNFNKDFECNKDFQINFTELLLCKLNETNIINKNKDFIDYCVGIVNFCDEIMSSEIFISGIDQEMFNLHGLFGSHRFLRLMALDKEMSSYQQKGIKTLVTPDLKKLQVYDHKGDLSEIREYNKYGHLQAIIQVEHVTMTPFDNTAPPRSAIIYKKRRARSSDKKFATRPLKEEPK